MRKVLILAGFLALFAAKSVLAGESVVATIYLTVYLQPEESTTQIAAEPAVAEHCATILASARDPDATSCQEQATLYTWERDSGAVTLLIAPI